MQTAARPPSDKSGARLEAALKDLGFAIQSLRLYPPTSPVVRRAVMRSSESLSILLDRGRVTLEVTPRSLRHKEHEVGSGNRIIEQLARRLHGHGIARLYFDPRLRAPSLQKLAELFAADRRDYDDRGGLPAVFAHDSPAGVQVEFLDLERLFDEDAEETVEDIWVALLEGFRLDAEVDDVDWAQLAGNVERLQSFVSWVADNIDNIAERTGYEAIDVYKFVLEQIGTLAAELGSEHVLFLVLAMRGIVDRVDPDTLIELLADPLEMEVRGELKTPAGAESMALADFLGGAGTGADDPLGMSAERRTIDITQVIAGGLDPADAQDLILHTMRTKPRSSTRLYGLFSRLMEGREDRASVARRVRGLLEKELLEADGSSTLLDNWPRLLDVLEGEAPERFVSSQYNLALQSLLADDTLRDVWDIDRIRPRLAEMKPAFVVQRKALVLADVLEIEQDDDSFRVIARALEKALHEAAFHNYHYLVSSLLRSVHAVTEDASRTAAQRQIAGAVLDGFYRPAVLRGLLRNALRGSGTEVEAVARIVELRAEAAVPVLLDSLADEDARRVRHRLVQILNDLGGPALDAVVARLDDDRWYFVRNLLLLLGESGNEALAEPIIPLARHDDARVRRQAVESITKLGGPSAAEALAAACEDPDDDVRVAALHGVGFHGSSGGIERALRLLSLPNVFGQNSEVVKTAAIALGRLLCEPSRDRLSKLARRPWIFARRRAPVTEASQWALAALDGERPGPAPEPVALRGVRPGRQRRKVRLR